MELSIPIVITICVLFFVVASLYSSVGHGGASGYLAVLSFFSFAPMQMSSTALILNLLVAGIGFFSFYRAGHFNDRITWPFLITSVPAAFIGGMIHVTTRNYSLLLALVLIFAAFRLISEIRSKPEDSVSKFPSLLVALPVGAGIGLISGIVGVGGGIFLSPLILFMKWADPKQTSATSACFILVNSLAGLLGRFTGGSLEIGMLAPFVFTAFLGGLVGSYMGANLLSGSILRRILGVILLIASYKLLKLSL